MASFEQLVFDIIANDKGASAAFDKFRNSVDQTSGSVDKNSAALDKNSKSLDKSGQSNRSALGTVVGLGVAMSAMSAPLTAATLGFGAFAGMALPSVVKVTTAMTGPGGLSAAWGTLDTGQRNAALGIQSLATRYGVLAKAMEPQTMQVFSSGLVLANSLLGPTATLAAAAGQGIESFLVQFTQNSGIQTFISFLAKEAGPAFTLLGTDVTNISRAVFMLLESFGGVGMTELKAFTAVMTGLTDSIAWLSVHAGGLTGVALGVAGLALALSKLGLLSGVLKFTGLSVMASEAVSVMKGMEGATIATKAMSAAQAGLDAVSPWVWGAAAVASLVALLYITRNVQGGALGLIAIMSKQDQATGLNVAGYARLADGLKSATVAQVADVAATKSGINYHGVLTSSINSESKGVGQLTAAQVNAQATARNLKADFTSLGAQYGMTGGQVSTLIVKSGVLNELLKANGVITPDVAAKIRAWASAEATGAVMTNAAAIAVQALTAAMQKNIGTVLTLQGDEISWRQAQQAATAQLASNSAGLKGNSAAAELNKAALLASTQQVVTFANNQLTLRGNLHAASNEIAQQIIWLQKHGEKSQFAAAEVAALLKLESQIKSQIGTDIVVRGSGIWNIAGTAGKTTTGPRGSAAGWYISGGVPGKDSVPVLGMPGELIVPTGMVAAGAVDHLRGRIPGFAAGGVVGRYADGVPGLGRWLSGENAATLLAIERGTAAAVAAGMRAAQAPGGGGYGGGTPGGGTPGMNARLAQLMMGAWSGGAAWQAWNYVAMRESGWNNLADNASSGAYGIAQALPYTKMPKAAWPPWAGGSASAESQIGWMISYIQSVYGSPQNAAAHELAFSWYDTGQNYLPPGLSLAMNGTGKPERVGGGGNTYQITVNMAPGTDRDTGRKIVEAIRTFEKGSGAGWRK